MLLFPKLLHVHILSWILSLFLLLPLLVRFHLYLIHQLFLQHPINNITMNFQFNCLIQFPKIIITKKKIAFKKDVWKKIKERNSNYNYKISEYLFLLFFFFHWLFILFSSRSRKFDVFKEVQSCVLSKTINNNKSLTHHL